MLPPNAMTPDVVTPTPPARRRRTRRWLRLGLVLAAALGATWLLSNAVPRSAVFVERRGRVAETELGPETASTQGFLTRGVRVTATTGLRVNLRVLRPADSTPRPLVVLLAGHRTGRDAVDVVGDPAGVVIAAIDYPYHGPEKPRGLVQSVNAVPQIRRGLLDTPPAVSLALDWLLTQPWVDRERVELVGVSLGVPFAAVAGALDARFHRVWLIHGGDDNRAWLSNRLESRMGSAVVREPVASLLHLLAYGPSFDAKRWVPRIAPRTVMVIGANADEQMPRASVERLHALAAEPKELLWSEGGHVSTKRLDIVRELLDLVRSRIATEERHKRSDTNPRG